jgi:hypothetical protein
MPTTEAEEYVKRAEECLRLAGACIAESNRQILVYAAVHWRMLAEEAAARSAPAHRPKSIEPNPRAITPGRDRLDACKYQDCSRPNPDYAPTTVSGSPPKSEHCHERENRSVCG